MAPTPSAPEAARLLALIGAEPLPPGGGSAWVAYSGGRDSTVLLHLLVRQRAALAPRVLRALHVNHGLQAAAADFAAHCTATCSAWQIPLTVTPVDARPRRGESPEAAARRARYGAFRARLAPGDLLLTAHHRGDQAETVLLRALRGTGPDGLAAMAVRARLGVGTLLRPLLDWRAEDVAAYAVAHGLAWVEDPTNRTARHDRSFLRTRIVPQLTRRWPGAEAALARLAGHARAQRGVSEVLAERVLELCGAGATLPLAALEGLPPATQRALVRRWLARHGERPPPAARLQNGLSTLLTAAADRRPMLAWGTVSLRRYRRALWLAPHPLPRPPTSPLQWYPAQPLVFPGLGSLRAEPAVGDGLARARAPLTSTIEVRFRAGGEQLRLAAGHRPVKKLLQEHAVPPWQRARVPLLYVGADCVAVAGVAVAEGWRPASGESGWVPVWEPAGA